MKRGIWIGLAATLAFATIVIARLPASWFTGYLPQGIACAQVAGTVWNGACTGLATPGGAFGDLNWTIHPASLLSGKVGSHLALHGPATSLTAELLAGPDGSVDARDVIAQFALDRTPLSQIPEGLRGTVHAELKGLSLDRGVVTAIEGWVEVQGLEKLQGRLRELGDYRLTFPATRAQSRQGEPVGDLDSLAGPFSLEGTLRLTPDPGFEIDGSLGAGPGAPPEIVQELSYLGPADARGRRPFSLAGSF